MAGVKGRSGGPRKNSGGARDGAGRPPKEPEIAVLPHTDDPILFLTAVMNDTSLDIKERKDAAKAILAHQTRIATGEGKKEAKQAAAEEASVGKFRPAQPPKLKVVN